jgi:hypothetical protein
VSCGICYSKKKFFLLSFVFLFCFFCWTRLRRLGLVARLHGGGLLGAALDRGSILLGAAVKAALGSRPALGLKVLLGLHGEGEVLGAAVAVDERRGHALVCDRAVVAALGLLPALLLKDASLRIREEERGLAVAARQVRARRLGALLGLAAVRTARRLRPALLLEEDLVLAREGERAAAVRTGQVKVLRQSRAVALGLLLAVLTATSSLLALDLCGLLLSGLALSLGLRLLLRNLLLQLRDALGRTRQEVAQLLRVFTHREAVEAVVAVRLGLDEHLAIDERHFVWESEELGGKVPG